MTQRSSSGTKTTRASSKPHCSLSTPSAGASSGSGSTVQPSIPLLDRATERCERPVRSSTRASRTVVPLSCAAAGLNAALIGYGQSSAVRIGLAGWRSKSSRVVHAVRSLAGAVDGGQSGRVEQQRRAVDGERRFGALVVVRRLLAEPVAAAAGREVVERPVEAVAAEEPVERPLRALRVLRIAGDGERGELGRDERRRVERLLVPASRGRLGAPRGRDDRSAGASLRRARTRRRASEAPPGPSRVRSSRPSAAPPTISACGSRALS